MKRMILILLCLVLTACAPAKDDIIPRDMSFNDEVSFGNHIIGISDDHTQIAVRDGDKLKIIDSISHEVISQERLNDEENSALDLKPNVRWSPNGKYILFTSPYIGNDLELRYGQNSHIYIYDINEEKLEAVYDVEPFDFSDNMQLVYAPTWMPDGNIAFIELGKKDTRIITLDLKSEDTETIYKEKDRGIYISDLVFLSEDKLVFTEQPSDMSKKKKVILYDLKEEDTTKVVSSEFQSLYIEEYNLNKRRLIVAHDSTMTYSTEDHLRVIEIITFDEKYEDFTSIEYDGYENLVNSVLSPNGNYLLSTIIKDRYDPDEKIYVIYDIEEEDDVFEFEAEGAIGYEGSFIQPGTAGVLGMFITPDQKLYAASNKIYRVYNLK